MKTRLNGRPEYQTRIDECCEQLEILKEVTDKNKDIHGAKALKKDLEQKGTLFRFLTDNSIREIQLVSKRGGNHKIEKDSIILKEVIDFCLANYKVGASKSSSKKGRDKDLFFLSSYAIIKELRGLGVDDGQLASYFKKEIETFKREVNRISQDKRKELMKDESLFKADKKNKN